MAKTIDPTIAKQRRREYKRVWMRRYRLRQRLLKARQQSTAQEPVAVYIAPHHPYLSIGGCPPFVHGWLVTRDPEVQRRVESSAFFGTEIFRLQVAPLPPERA